MQKTENDNSVTKIKLQKGWVVIRKRKQKAILHTRRHKIHVEPEKYYHAKLLLNYPWKNEDDIISPFTTYHESYISKQEIIHQNAKRFNEGLCGIQLGLARLGKQYITVCMGDGCSKYSTGRHNNTCARFLHMTG